MATVTDTTNIVGATGASGATGTQCTPCIIHSSIIHSSSSKLKAKLPALMASCKLCNAPPYNVRPIDKIMADIQQRMNIPTDPYHAIGGRSYPSLPMGLMGSMGPMGGITGPFRPRFHELARSVNQIVYPDSKGVTGPMGPMDPMGPMGPMRGRTGPFRPRFHELVRSVNQIVYPDSKGVTGTAITPQ